MYVLVLVVGMMIVDRCVVDEHKSNERINGNG